VIARIWRGWTTPQNADAKSTQAYAAVQLGRELVPTAFAAVDAQVLVTGDDAVLAVCQPQTSGRRRHGLWEATVEDTGGRRWLGWETALGGLLLLLGIVVLLGQALDLDLGRVGWPFFVIVPGLGLLGLGLATTGRVGEVLATVGGVVTMTGLVLGVQNATDRFDTWAYAWALVVLVGAGIGRWLVGLVRGRADLAASGGWLIAAGLVAFLVLAVFFEVVVGIGGGGGALGGSAGRYGLAALLILAGLVLLGRRLLTARRP
jgi:hypothetical protein